MWRKDTPKPQPLQPSQSPDLLIRLLEQNSALVEQNIALVEKVRLLTYKLAELERPRGGSRGAEGLPVYDPEFYRSDAGAEHLGSMEDVPGLSEAALRESFRTRS
jgi:hypothetical protein